MKQDFYLSILNLLKQSTNLNKIKQQLNLSKQQLNYYLSKLQSEGLIKKKAYGFWEVNQSKNTTNYGSHLPKDFIRGHAYVWSINIPKEIKGWANRINLLKERGINIKIVGAKENTPRIKVLGRKVWLCNNKIRIFDIPNKSYYGSNAIESRKLAFSEFLLIVNALESKLGITLKPLDFSWNKEHYALIKNDLAIDQNRKGIVIRISDESGEWLVIDDSLEKGGELENIGKKALVTNIPMQKWWNDNKKHNFEVTPTFLLNSINQVTQNQIMFNQNFESHIEAIKTLSQAVKELQIEVSRLRKDNNII